MIHVRALSLRSLASTSSSFALNAASSLGMTAPVVREAEKDLEALSESHGGSLPWREATSGSRDRVAAGGAGFFFLDAGTNASLEKSAGEKRGRRGKKKKTSTVKSVADAESMFGGRGKKKK